MRVDDVNRWDGKCTSTGTCECKSPTDSSDTGQWSFHNYSRAKRAVEVTRYSTRIGTDPTEAPRSLDNYVDPHYSHNAHLVRRRSALYTCCTCNYKACKGWSFDTLHHVTPMWISKTKCLRMFFGIFDFLCNKVSRHAQPMYEIFTLYIYIVIYQRYTNW